MVNAQNIPLEVDVWNVIEDELRTRLTDVLDLHFEYNSRIGAGARIKIRHPKDSRIAEKTIFMDAEEARDLIIELSRRFNFQWTNISKMTFWLNPGVAPEFNIDIQPVVSDPSTLDDRKPRMNMLTID